jgi:hypothetical protein
MTGQVYTKKYMKRRNEWNEQLGKDLLGTSVGAGLVIH